MPVCDANGTQICFDTYGNESDPALVLIRGLGAQMIAWREEFCEDLAARGFRVIIFDNRDVGLSQKFEGVDYTLSDMASDTAGLLDHLEVDAAHVVGMSLGGMIAQTLAIEHPDRVLSLCSIMSTVGGADSVMPTGEAAAVLASPPADSREEAIDRDVASRRVIGSPGFPFDGSDARRIAAEAYDRCYCPEGRARQIAAARSSGSRKEGLATLRIPVLVIHGADDPLVPVANGHRTAEAVPGAELLIVPGMGHDLPRGAWPQIIDAIVANTRRSVRATS